MSIHAINCTKEEIRAAIGKLREAYEAVTEGRVVQALSATREATRITQHAEGALEDACPSKEAA